MLGLVAGPGGRKTPRVADSPAAGAGRVFHNKCYLLEDGFPLRGFCPTRVARIHPVVTSLTGLARIGL